MENSESTTDLSQELTQDETDMQKLCEAVFIVKPSVLSEEVRDLLDKVMELHGSLDKSVAWLIKPNNALDGKQPVELIREDKVRRLKDFWEECERRYGY
jgi:hypothetical protein